VKLLLPIILLISILESQSIQKIDANIKNSVAKIFTVSNVPSFSQPWISVVKKTTGSGYIVEGNKILTNAHVVSDNTYIEVLKNGETKRYEAEVIHISHDGDLALLSVKNKEFFKGTKPLYLGKLPNLQEEVTVYGFPTGGETLSITKGVISRIEHIRYAHSGKPLLAIQIDAAVNPGNSGGPAISGGKVVGLVMQGKRSSQNIGYIIPTQVVKHFLKDIEDKKYNGFPFLGITIQSMDSPVLKQMYGIKDSRHGVLISKIVPNSPASQALKIGDILINSDGYKIFTNGKVEFREKEYTSFGYSIDKHQIGDEVVLKVLRDGKKLSLKIRLDKTYDELTLVKRRKYEQMPTYFIYGGIVFVPGINKYRIPFKYRDEFPNKEKEELVLLNQVLSSELTKGFNRVGSTIITEVNGKSFKNFKEFVNIVESIQDRYVVFKDENNIQIVVDSNQVKKDQSNVLKRYNIRSSKSDDLTK
jgi:S1-C subfamily serine protease